MNKCIEAVVSTIGAPTDVAKIVVGYTNIELEAGAFAYFAVHPSSCVWCHPSDECAWPIAYQLTMRKVRGVWGVHVAGSQRSDNTNNALYDPEWLDIPSFIDLYIVKSAHTLTMCGNRIVDELVARFRKAASRQT